MYCHAALISCGVHATCGEMDSIFCQMHEVHDQQRHYVEQTQRTVDCLKGLAGSTFVETLNEFKPTAVPHSLQPVNLEGATKRFKWHVNV